MLISPFAYMISSAFWGYNQRMAEYGDQEGLVEPRVKVTILLMTKEELGGHGEGNSAFINLC